MKAQHAGARPVGDRLDWYLAAKFGLFIHWVAYSKVLTAIDPGCILDLSAGVADRSLFDVCWLGVCRQ